MNLPGRLPDNVGVRKRLGEQVGLSNEVIPDNEKHIIRVLRSDAQDDLEALDSKIACMEGTLASLRQERKAAVAKMAQFDVALASEKLLPPELLSRVFVLALSESGTRARYGVSNAAPWIFLRVCSRWRQVALGQHRIWQRLTVEVSNGESVQSLFRHLWARSPTSSVSLDLKKLSDYTRINDILSEYSSRLQNFSINIPSPALAEVLWSPPVAFERLESLHLRDFSDCQALQSHSLTKFADAPNLRKLHIVGRETRFSCQVNLKIAWSQLVDLQFTQVAFPNETIFSILSQCVKLTNLKVTLGTLCIFRKVPQIPPPIILPDLRNLTIVLDQHKDLGDVFQRLTAPALKDVNVSHWGKVHQHLIARHAFPHAEFTEMLQRSGAIIEVLSFVCPIFNVDVDALLNSVPSLTSVFLGKRHPVTERTFTMMRDKGFLQDLARLTCFTTSPQSFLSLLEHQCGHAAVTSQGLRSGYVSCRFTDGVYERFEVLKQRLIDSGKDIQFVENWGY